MNERILITGAVGFIGYHLSHSLLDSDKKVCGIDNINSYYDTNLKKNRLSRLYKKKKFSFHENDIVDRDTLKKIFLDFKPDIVIHLAAQAGVRYSIKNPYAYLDSNLIGFLNIIECCREYNIGNFIYASSSSVYGGNKKIPFSEDDRVDTPVSLYAATKKSNELIASSYSSLYDLNTTGLRFFTVYGPWGRPDMAYYSFTEKIASNEKIKIFNNGLMKRDFTYIDDIVSGINSAIDKNFKCEIFNLGNNKTEELMRLVSLIEQELDIKSNIEYMPMQPGDVKQTYADITKAQELLNYSPKINLDEGIKLFINWYKKYNQNR